MRLFKTGLSVLGADDGGEANLTYTWTALSRPKGATVTFSANGTNIAKNTTVSFSRAGSYTFQVAIADPRGLSASGRVSVVVQQMLTSISIVPSRTPRVFPGRTVQFTVTGLDQFGRALATQPTFSMSIVSGPGSISSTGLFTASRTTRGLTTMETQVGTISKRVTVKTGRYYPGGPGSHYLARLGDFLKRFAR